MQVYLVKGETGEYEDYRDWIVCAFLSLQSAKRFVYKLNRILKNYGIDKFEIGREIPTRIEDKLHKLDPKFERTYTGTKYCVVTVPVTPEEKPIPSNIFDI